MSIIRTKNGRIYTKTDIYSAGQLESEIHAHESGIANDMTQLKMMAMGDPATFTTPGEEMSILDQTNEKVESIIESIRNHCESIDELSLVSNIFDEWKYGDKPNIDPGNTDGFSQVVIDSATSVGKPSLKYEPDNLLNIRNYRSMNDYLNDSVQELRESGLKTEGTQYDDMFVVYIDGKLYVTREHEYIWPSYESALHAAYEAMQPIGMYDLVIRGLRENNDFIRSLEELGEIYGYHGLAKLREKYGSTESKTDVVAAYADAMSNIMKRYILEGKSIVKIVNISKIL